MASPATWEIESGKWLTDSAPSPAQLPHIALSEGSQLPAIPKHNCDYQDPSWSRVFFAGVRTNDLKLAFNLKSDGFQKVTIPYAADLWGRRNYPYLYAFSAAVYVGYESEANYWQILFSPRFGEVAIFNPANGIVRAVPVAIPPGKNVPVEITSNPSRIVVCVDGQVAIDFVPERGQVNDGKVGFGGYCASVDFSDVRIETPGHLKRVPAPAHRARFSRRDWLGEPWVFDGDEPVARIAPGIPQDDGFVKSSLVAMTQVKLRPGDRPLLPITLSWGCQAVEKIVGAPALSTEGGTHGGFVVRLDWADQTRTTRVNTTAEFRHDPADGRYQVEVSYGGAFPAELLPMAITFGSFFPYNVVGPSSKASTPSGWCREFAYRLYGGAIEPLNHAWMMTSGCFRALPLPPEQFTLAPGVAQAWGYLGTDGSPVREVLAGRGSTGSCQWIYDITGPTVTLTNSPSDCIHRSRIRLLSDREEKRLWDYIRGSKVAQDREVALFEPTRTTFGPDGWHLLSTPFDREAFLPPHQYSRDTGTGHGDKDSLLLNPDSTVRLEATGGASDWGEIWTDADTVLAEMRVKTEAVDGKGVRLVVSDTIGKKVYESQYVNNAGEWQHVTLPLPGGIKLFVLRIEKDGKGKAWIDDVSMRKTNGKDGQGERKE